MFLEVLLNFIFFPPISYFFQSYFSKSLSEINSIFSKKKIKKLLFSHRASDPSRPSGDQAGFSRQKRHFGKKLFSKKLKINIFEIVAKKNRMLSSR
jgi:hypothetical protein